MQNDLGHIFVVHPGGPSSMKTRKNIIMKTFKFPVGVGFFFFGEEVDVGVD